MSVEMACGSCQGRFVVAAAGTVACPHCGAHLAVSAEMFSAPDATITIPEDTTDSPVTVNAVEPTFSGYAGLADADQSDDEIKQTDEPAAAADASDAEEKNDAEPVDVPGRPANDNEAAENEIAEPAKDQSSDLSAAVPVVGESVGPVDEDAATLPDFSELEFGDAGPPAAEAATEMPSFDLEADEATVAFNGFDQPGENVPDAMFAEGDSPFDNVDDQRETHDAFPDFGAAADDNQSNGVEGVLGDAATAATIVEEQPAAIAAETNPGFDKPVTESSSPPPTAAATSSTGDVSRTKFFLLASYASAVTLVCLWLIYLLLTGKYHLENLRDPADPPKSGEKKTVQLFQIDARMPRGHLLQLGESRRFGNILVEPLKVTRGPLDFVPYSSEIATNTKPPDASEIGPTLKLWLRLTNVSDDQTIAPLGSVLLYSNRVRSEDNYDELRGNTFVCRAADKKKDGHLVYVYSLNLNKSWDLRGQNLKELAPGESMETYIAAGPAGIDKLKGDLLWRVHFRKGFSPSGKGVTTLFEVDFQSDDIQAESATPAKQATASL